MVRQWIGSSLIGILLTAGLAAAETARPALVTVSATVSSPSDGAFDRLSPRDQKIVRALFEAQKPDTGASLLKPLTLDQIAAAKRSGRGWGEVFQVMRGQGLVTEKSLGEVVSKFDAQKESQRVSRGR